MLKAATAGQRSGRRLRLGVVHLPARGPDEPAIIVAKIRVDASHRAEGRGREARLDELPAEMTVVLRLLAFAAWHLPTQTADTADYMTAKLDLLLERRLYVPRNGRVALILLGAAWHPGTQTADTADYMTP